MVADQAQQAGFVAAGVQDDVVVVHDDDEVTDSGSDFITDGAENTCFDCLFAGEDSAAVAEFSAPGGGSVGAGSGFEV